MQLVHMLSMIMETKNIMQEYFGILALKLRFSVRLLLAYF